MDPVLAEGLAVELGRAQPGVELLRREVRGLADRANELGLPTQENPAWRLSGFLQDSADVADEIRHRIELLVRWQEAVFLGHATEPLWATSVSTSGLPEVIALLNELAYVDENTVAAWVVKVLALTQDERGLLIGAMSDDDLRRFGELLPTLTQDERRALLDGVLPAASAEDIRRLHDTVPGLEPLLTGDREYVYVDRDLSAGRFSWEDVYQGGLGDCRFLAALQSTAVASPKFLQDHIRLNDNGTYTVTLYVDGKEVDVTVTAYLPDSPYAYFPENEGERLHNWVAVYEKAAAELVGRGDYADLEGSVGGFLSGKTGTGGIGLELVSGSSGMDLSPPNHGYYERLLDEGRAVTLSTDPTADWPLIGRDDLVPGHVYVVVGVVEKDGREVLHIHNPWGKTLSEDIAIDLYLTPFEASLYFPIIHWGPPKEEL